MRLRFVLMLFVGMVAVVASVISALGYGLVCGIREARGDEFDRFCHTTVASVPLLWLPVAVGLVGLMAGVCFSVSAERTYPLAVGVGAAVLAGLAWPVLVGWSGFGLHAIG